MASKKQKLAETRYNKDGKVIGTKTDSAGMQYFGKQVAAAMSNLKPAAAKASAPKGSSVAKKRAAAAAAKPVTAKVERPSVSAIGVSGLSKATPKAINVTPSRTYTDKEKQINALLITGKKKDGTMKGSAQRKIQKIRKK